MDVIKMTMSITVKVVVSSEKIQLMVNRLYFIFNLLPQTTLKATKAANII